MSMISLLIIRLEDVMVIKPWYVKKPSLHFRTSKKSARPNRSPPHPASPSSGLAPHGQGNRVAWGSVGTLGSRGGGHAHD
jgi:hypothetical protein